MATEEPSTSYDYRVCLVGSGGVGTIASLVLTKSGRAHVTAVLRSKYAHVSQHGWKIDSVDHGQLDGWKPHRVVGTVAEAAVAEETEKTEKTEKVEYDYVVVCTKQLPSHNPVAAMIAPLVTAGRTAVVLIQNGVGIEDEIVAAWPGNVVISSVSHIGSVAAEPNIVRQSGPDMSKMGAHWHAGVSDDVSEEKAAAFVALYCAGLEAGDAKDAKDAKETKDTKETRESVAPRRSSCEHLAGRGQIETARWEKLLWNGSFNPVCALTRSDVGEVQRSRGRESLLLPLMWEIWHTAKAAGHPLPDDIVSWMAYRLPDTTAYRPSMLVDLESGRPMELDVILGNPRRTAHDLGVPTPVMDTVHKLLQIEQWKMDSKTSP